jgi:hypothetical protein
LLLLFVVSQQPAQTCKISYGADGRLASGCPAGKHCRHNDELLFKFDEFILENDVPIFEPKTDGLCIDTRLIQLEAGSPCVLSSQCKTGYCGMCAFG